MVRRNEWIFVVAQMNNTPQHLFCLERSVFIDLVGDSWVQQNECVVSVCIWCCSMNYCILKLVHILNNCLCISYFIITTRKVSWLVCLILNSEVFLCFFSRSYIPGINYYRILQCVWLNTTFGILLVYFNGLKCASNPLCQLRSTSWNAH